ncbi:hypothetical protein SEEH3374_10454, partial [Salmonella enterica subsp. enterica serovar Heidelberg str. RI-11-013374]
NGIVEFTPETGTECRPFTILKRYLYQIIKFIFIFVIVTINYMFLSVISEPEPILMGG